MVGRTTISVKYMVSGCFSLCTDGFNLEILPPDFVMQRQILINVIVFAAYVLNLPLNTQRPHHCSQRAGKWSFILAHDSRPIYRAPTYIAVPLLGPQQLRYIRSTLYIFTKYLFYYNSTWSTNFLWPSATPYGIVNWSTSVQVTVCCFCAANSGIEQSWLQQSIRTTSVKFLLKLIKNWYIDQSSYWNVFYMLKYPVYLSLWGWWMLWWVPRGW